MRAREAWDVGGLYSVGNANEVSQGAQPSVRSGRSNRRHAIGARGVHGTQQALHHALAAAASKATRRQTADVDIAWAAGFFDADGHIGAPTQRFAPYPNGRPRAPSMRLVAAISQNNQEVLEEFLQIAGARGKIYRTKRNIGQNRQCYVLVFDGRHALEVIYLLRPFLRRKQYEADAAKDLAIKGRLGMYPGPKGLPPAVKRARLAGQRKLRKLK